MGLTHTAHCIHTLYSILPGLSRSNRIYAYSALCFTERETHITNKKTSKIDVIQRRNIIEEEWVHLEINPVQFTNTWPVYIIFYTGGTLFTNYLSSLVDDLYSLL